MIRVLLAVITACLARTASADDACRWFYMARTFGSDADVAFVSNVVERAAAKGYNGMVLSANIDSAFAKRDQARESRLRTIKAFCDSRGVEIIPMVWSVGYGTMLDIDPDCIEALPVKGVSEPVPAPVLIGDKWDVNDTIPGRRRFGVRRKLRPFRHYRFSVKVRTAGIPDGTFMLQVYRKDSERKYLDLRPQLNSNGNWVEAAIEFNPYDQNEVFLWCGYWGYNGSGTVEVKDAKLEDLGFPDRPIRRAGLAREGDTDWMGCPRMKDKWGQRCCCMANPKLYEHFRDSARWIQDILQPKTWFLSMDEIRLAGTCAACAKKPLPSLLADCLIQQRAAIRAVNPKAEICLWNDMVDVHHNATDGFFAVNGSFAGALDLLPRDLIIVDWHWEKRDLSLPDFAKRGFRTIGAGFYDVPVAQRDAQTRSWMESLNRTKGAVGTMYTTWCRDYSYLEGFADCVRAHEARPADPKPQAVFGVISDLHITDEASTAHFRRALSFFDRRRADGVVVCGDLTDNGKLAQKALVDKTWAEAFPGNRRSDGARVERLFIYGDHDTNTRAELFKVDRDKRIDIRKVKGFDFVLASYDGEWGNDIPHLDRILKDLAPDPRKPFFYVQHRVMKGTVGGPEMWGQDIGQTTKALSDYPNAVAFCGHCHMVCVNEKNVWQDAFTAVEIPSLSYNETPSGRENGFSINDGRRSHTWEWRSSNPPRMMTPDLPRDKDDVEGCLMSVFSNEIRIVRYDMKTLTKVASDWRLPFPIPPSKPFSHEVRARTEPAPEFPTDARVAVDSAADRYTVSFPVAASTASTPRAFDYEISAVLIKGNVERIGLQKRVYSKKMHLDETRDRGPVVCVFAKTELPDDFDALRFDVRPIGCFGRKGRSVSSAVLDRPAVRDRKEVPLLGGFHPDPSICRVGRDYYLATSSFTWFPGLPVYKSNDLRHWKICSHVFVSDDWRKRLTSLKDSAGVYAPTIRHRNGRFYIIVNINGYGGVLASSARAEGPWELKKTGGGADPSLFFDEDGTCWEHHLVKPAECAYPNDWVSAVQKFDLEKGIGIGPATELPHAVVDRQVWAEGAHIYRIGKRYLMLQAEGGTGFAHSETAFWADDVTGPYLPQSVNPVLTQRHRGPKAFLQATGHADLVATPDGRHYAVFLGQRFIPDMRGKLLTPLARETFMCPAEITDGNLYINDGEFIPGTFEDPEGDFYETTMPGLKLKRPSELAFTERRLISTSHDGVGAALVYYRSRQGYFALRKNAAEIVLEECRGEKAEIVGRLPFSEDEAVLELRVAGTSVKFFAGADATHLRLIGGERSIAVVADDPPRNVFNGVGVGVYRPVPAAVRIGGGWHVAVLSDDPVVRHAANDLSDFFRREFKLVVPVSDGESAGRRITVGVASEENPLRSRVRIAADGIRITGATPREAAQGCYRFEDMLMAARRPELPCGERTFTRLFSPRMTHSSTELDRFPNDELDRIARAGMDAILVYVAKSPDTTRNGKIDMNDLVGRAAERGLDVYAYAFDAKGAAACDPTAPDAVEQYDRLYGSIVRNAPGLKGMVFVGESTAFRSHLSGMGGFYWNREKDRHTFGFWPSLDWVDWLKAVKTAVRRHRKDFDVVFWTYNWFNAPEPERRELLEKIPTDVSVLVTFEMGGVADRYKGVPLQVDDYSICRAGPSTIFTSEAEVIHRRGIKFLSMANSGGRTWDFGGAPCEPAPYLWLERFKALRMTQKDYGLAGLMDSHHFGWSPGVIADFAKEAFTLENSVESLEARLSDIAVRSAGAEAAPCVLAAWRDWSDAMRLHPANTCDQYGPLRLGPSFPFTLSGEPLPPKPRGKWMFVRKDYFLPLWRFPALQELARRELRLWERGTAAMADAVKLASPDRRAWIEGQVRLGAFCASTVKTVVNFRDFRMAEHEKNQAGLLAALAAERENVRHALETFGDDPTLGREPSMGVVVDREHLEWKLKQLDEKERVLAR